MCPDNSNPRDNAPCNRQPFQSESGCDRGSVDVHQFDDLPYCGPLALTRPDIPPEVVDGPVPLPLPTFSCTCINIDHKFNLAYSRIGGGEGAAPVAGPDSDYRFDASVSFKAKGDCCEGNYESRLNLRIPCPVKCQTESAAPRLAVGIGYGSGPQTASASILRTNCESCTLEAMPASLNLNIPCPVTTARKVGDDKRLHVSIKYGSTPFRGDPLRKSSVSMSYLSYDEANCKIGPHTTRVKLSLPCPIKVPGGPWHREVKLLTKLVSREEMESRGVEVLTLDSSVCALIPPKSPDPVTLQVRCPVVNNISNGPIEVAVSYGDGPGKKTLLNMDGSRCEIAAVEKEVHLNIPCPFQDGVKTMTINGTKAAYASFNKTTCQMEMKDVAFNIQAITGCPVGNGGKGVLAFRPITFYKGSLHTATQEFVTKPNSRCGIDIGNMTFGLSVPCPIKNDKGKKKLRAKTKLGGLNGLGGVSSIGWESISFASIGESCSLALNGGSFNLTVPCPIGKDNLKIEARATTTSASSASMYVESTTGGGCTRTITIHATIPKARPYWL